MDRNGILTVTLLFLIVLDCSDAFLVWNLLILVGGATKDNSSASQISPLPGPNSGGKQSNPGSVDADKSGKEKHENPQAPNNSSKVNPKGSNNENNNTASVSPPTDEKIDKVKSHEEKEKLGNERHSRFCERRQLFDQVPYKDTVLWTSVISAYNRCNHPRKALQLFSLMLRQPDPPTYQPNHFIFATVARAIASSPKYLQLGQAVHARTVKFGFVPNSVGFEMALLDYRVIFSEHLEKKKFS